MRASPPISRGGGVIGRDGDLLLTNVALKSQGLSNLVNADERCVSNLTENSGKDLREGSAETGETCREHRATDEN